MIDSHLKENEQVKLKVNMFFFFSAQEGNKRKTANKTKKDKRRLYECVRYFVIPEKPAWD